MDPRPDTLWNLLPAESRVQDLEAGGALRALLALVQREADIVQADIERLYEDEFVETAADWAVPYIGDLVSNRTLYDSRRSAGPDTAFERFADLQGVRPGGTLRPPIAIGVRADVAKTIYFRRRKGTPAMLEELARDVTGWPAHLVEFFERIAWTQMREHLRPQAALLDVRSVERCDRIGGAFDDAQRCPDVRAVAQDEGRPGVRGIGIYLWRLGAYPLVDVPAPSRDGAPAWQRHASPLAADQPLFCHRRRDGDDAARATELDVPAAIRRSLFYADLTAWNALPVASRPQHTQLYGLFAGVEGVVFDPFADGSLFLLHDRKPVAPAQISCRRLDPWPAAAPKGLVVAVDVTNGRLALGDGFDASKDLDVLWHYGAAADLGGGPYDRRRWLLRGRPETTRLRVKADGVAPPGTPPVTHTSVAAALASWAVAPIGRGECSIEILDSRSYPLPATIRLRSDQTLALEAADRERPLLLCDPAGLTIDVDPAPAGDDSRDSALTLSGVLVQGALEIAGDLGRLRLLHSTLVPGGSLGENGEPVGAIPSITARATDAGGAAINLQLEIEAAFSITGPILAPAGAAGILLLDSIVDGLDADPKAGLAVGAAAPDVGPPLECERTTILGQTRVRRLAASESILAGTVFCERTQDGCVRFSFTGPDSRTPRRFRCQPDLAVGAALTTALAADPTLSQAAQDALKAEVRASVVPQWHERRYARPAYGQLRLSTPLGIRRGAEDASEMGVLCHVKQAQREANLRLRLDEYLPFGLDAGPIYVN